MHDQRDLDRSSWWKSATDQTSSIKRMQHWVKINDIRYGIDDKQNNLKYHIKDARNALMARSSEQIRLPNETEMGLMSNRSGRVGSQEIRIDSEASRYYINSSSCSLRADNITDSINLTESKQGSLSSENESMTDLSNQVSPTKKLVSSMFPPLDLNSRSGKNYDRLSFLPLREL